MFLPLIRFLWLLFTVGQLLEAASPVASPYITPDLKTLVSTVVPLRPDGKIKIPAHIKHVKLDIGLSYSAPMSQYWLTHEDDLLVFGFEPHPGSVASILQGAIKQNPLHGDPLETRFIGKNFFLIPCALGLSENNTIQFFVTANDCGCSSIYPPKLLPVERIIKVPIFSLAAFFDLFPFDSHPVIDYIKIDAQGADLDIVKSAGHYLVERVIYITIEADGHFYQHAVDSPQDIDNYMKSIGFIKHVSSNTVDPTYFNPRFADYIKNNRVQIYQKG